MPHGGLGDLDFLDFGAFAFLPPSLGPPGDCPWRHEVRVESWFPWQVTRVAGAPGPGAVPELPEIKEKSGIRNLVPVG